jgi:hypothetical protein
MGAFEERIHGVLLAQILSGRKLKLRKLSVSRNAALGCPVRI